MTTRNHVRLGALPTEDGTLFRVWAPKIDRIDLIPADDGSEQHLTAGEKGYHERHIDGLGAGFRYQYRLDGNQEFPDPASRFQPEGVHGPSEVIDPENYNWSDRDWSGIPQDDLIFYELHVGAFTSAGSYRAVEERLPYLKDLGITAIELMPVGDFPGDRNWGYDPAALFAPSHTYGSPDDLRQLVDSAHQLGLAVYLDVIYNHLGPDGAYAAAYAPFFTDKHQTAWGRGINLDDNHSDGVRNFFIDNALYWLKEYHFDGLRLDATYALVDESETHFLAELRNAVKSIEDGPERILIAEDHRNLNTIVRPQTEDGYGLDGVWTDDFHHQIRNLTTGDTAGYFADFAGTEPADLAETIERGWFFDGRPSPTTGKPRGTDPAPVDPAQCVICIQNHDQVGNRPDGARLHHDISAALYRAVSALLLFVPETPLLFMGQEWSAQTPFLYFTDHNPELGARVREGRKEEFQDFPGFSGEVPDPQARETFRTSILNWDERSQDRHRYIHRLYRDLLALRRDVDGPAEVTATTPHGLAVRRDEFQLIVSLTTDQYIPADAGEAIAWSSEDEAYTDDPHPPDLQEDGFSFERAGAVVLRGS